MHLYRHYSWSETLHPSNKTSSAPSSGAADGGFAAQLDFVSNGSAPFKPYGNLGLGSGKMPGFAQVKTVAAPYLGAMLTPDQIKQIIYYERYCLDSTTYTAVSPVCETKTTSKSPPTTTTTVKKG